MTNPIQLPVLFLSDVVVLPGMVVRVELDEPARAAIDAAQLAARETGGADVETGSEAGGQVLVAPRLEGRYASYGVVAPIEKVGRFSGGAPAAVLKAGARARIGSGVTGPGAALWVEVEEADGGVVDDEVRASAAEDKSRVVGLLQRDGHHVVHAPQGLAALTALDTQAFDLALLDLDLPGIDGLSLARLIRARGLDLPLIALTARSDAEAEPAARAAGMSGFLRKPVTGEMLAGALGAAPVATA